jgi:hypothetical protein
MKYFLDTEFIEEPNTIKLISIGIVSEDGREYYSVSAEWTMEDIKNTVEKDDFVLKNVFPYVKDDFCNGNTKTIKQIREDILNFVGKDDKIEFWAYYADYDWVIFCWIFGKMIDLPNKFPYYCRDLQQLIDMCSLNERKLYNIITNVDSHNAISDARWNQKVYTYIQNNYEIIVKKVCNV